MPVSAGEGRALTAVRDGACERTSRGAAWCRLGWRSTCDASDAGPASARPVHSAMADIASSHRTRWEELPACRGLPDWSSPIPCSAAAAPRERPPKRSASVNRPRYQGYIGKIFILVFLGPSSSRDGRRLAPALAELSSIPPPASLGRPASVRPSARHDPKPRRGGRCGSPRRGLPRATGIPGPEAAARP
jgi:hypothetical protein